MKRSRAGSFMVQPWTKAFVTLHKMREQGMFSGPHFPRLMLVNSESKATWEHQERAPSHLSEQHKYVWCGGMFVKVRKKYFLLPKISPAVKEISVSCDNLLNY